MSKALVELIDVGSTLTDIAGTRLDGDRGRSLLPILSGVADPGSHREVAHSQIDSEQDPKELHNLLAERRDEAQAFLDTHEPAFYMRPSIDGARGNRRFPHLRG